MKICKRIFFSIILIILIFSMINCDSKSQIKGPIVVASKIDTEGSLLGNMIILILAENEFTITDKTQFGPTDLIRAAIINDEIDIYPEYTGNGAFFFSDATNNIWKDAIAGYNKVKQMDEEANDLIWLTPAPANNTWAIAIRKDIADDYGLKTLSDLGNYINNNGDFKLACSEEFVSSPAALPAFEEAYGFTLNESQLLVLSGGNTATTEQAAANKTNNVNAAMAYGTDGQLAALYLIVLEDNLNVQPVYEPAPIIRKEILEKYPMIEELLKPVFSSLDLVTLQSLNSQIAVEGKPAREVAYEYLKNNGYLK